MALRSTTLKLPTTIAYYTRQGLPRPARVSSFAHAKLPSPAPAPAYADMHGFLMRPMPYTLLPTPLPVDVGPVLVPGLATLLFPDSPTQDQLAVIDACLHDLHDVPRAKQVFERLRRVHTSERMLESRLYNALLRAYVEMATVREPADRALWVEDTWQLYHAMESGNERVQPTPQTYAIMLIAWMRWVLAWPAMPPVSCDAHVSGEDLTRSRHHPFFSIRC